MRLQLKLALGAQNAAATGKPVNREWYGLRFRDTFTVSGEDYTFNGLEYERTGMAAGYDQGLKQVPEDLLTVHNKLRRCVVDYEGKVKYYLDPTNSMWKEGSWKQLSVDNADGLVLGVTDNYSVVTDSLQVGNYQVEVDQPVDTAKIGCVMCLHDGDAAAWHAVIINAQTIVQDGVTKQVYTLSHPHIDGFGAVPEGSNTYYMIGDAKLGGQDGNVMVEIPSFWHKWSYEPDPDPAKADVTAKRAYYGWQHHQISLKELPGGHFYPKRYVGAFEGVIADAANNPQDGWYGDWDAATAKWVGATETPAEGTVKILSVAGYYAATLRSTTTPRRDLSVTEYRILCERDPGYHQYDAAANFIIQLLMIIEIGNRQTQNGIGHGVSNIGEGDWAPYNGYRPMRKTGDTISAGNGTCDVASDNRHVQIASSKYQINSLSYRGVEQPYGHIFKWVDGIVFSAEGDTTTAYAHKCIDGGVSGRGQYQSHGSPAAATADPNYIILPGIDGKDMAIVNVGRWWKIPSPHLLPNDDAVSRPLNAYTDDWFSPASSTGMRAFAVGGGANILRRDGAFCVYSSYGLGSSHSSIGGRLCCKI